MASPTSSLPPASPHGDDGGVNVVDKKLEDDVIAIGRKLYWEDESVDEIMKSLGKAEGLLARVGQKPSRSTGKAFFYLMVALTKDKLLKHADLKVQVAVASCFSEISRIAAPACPYDDDALKEFLKLINIAFKQLSCESGPNFSRAVDILKTTARVRSFLMMMDIDSALVVEMFQIFFNAISSVHSSDVFNCMETIISIVIKESDEISFELLSPLLDSVRKENEKTSPLPFELGKNVFENCEEELQPYVKEAVKTNNLNVDDYDEVVASLCKVENGTALVENGNTFQSETRSKRRIKPSFRIRDDEIYEHPWMKNRNSQEGSSDGNNEEQNLASRQSSQSKKKKKVINLQNDTEGKEITKKNESKDDADKMVESSISKPAKDKDPKKEKEKKPRRPSGEKLVNSRIQVWWPMDKTFYTGTVITYHAETKKHSILYDDGETEILNLRKETWELFDDDRSPVTKPAEEQDIDDTSPAKEPVKNEEKTAKRKTGSSKKREAASSSKRLKNENLRVTKSGKSSAPCIIGLDDESNDERHEPNVSTMDDGENQVVKDESEN